MTEAGPRMKNATGTEKNAALKFVVLIGVVSLFADMTYEGARSITGPFLAILGANAKTVGIVAGLGEFIGYGFRLVSGYISDKTGRYWAITLLGYFINMAAVPLLALAGNWEMAAVLIIAERMGKAVRTPARDTMLSHATHEMGRGWGFGLHEALDQLGATIGPLVVSAAIYFKEEYRFGFAILAVPALMSLAVLVAARLLYPHPHRFEVETLGLKSKNFPRRFWLYLLAAGLVAAGYADFPLMAYHFKKVSIASDSWIPIFYSVAMGVDALAALVLGRFFDRIGISILIFITALASLFAPLVFLGNFNLALAGTALWGVGMGAQESIMRAVVAQMVPADKRGSAYGVFNGGYGLFWFSGSVLMGVLYDWSISSLIVFSVAIQLASLPLLLAVKKESR